jgi:hypothetical protein
LQRYTLPDFLKKYLADIASIQQLLLPHLTKAPCHNDLNIGNVLFDGSKTWLIDWEAAGIEDPFFDLATVCNQFAFNRRMADIFIKTYFDQTPTQYQQAKLFLMRQIVYHYQAVHFLNYAASAGKIIVDAAVPDLYEWHLGYNQGFYQLTTTDDFLRYGLVQAKSAIAEINSKDFLKAKMIMS